jgi:hypothetical protein
VLSAIGDLNFDKLMVFEAGVDSHSRTYRYVKRPFYRDGDIMISGLLLPLPSQIPLLGALDSYHTVIPTKAHPCRNVFRQITRFLDLLVLHSVMISTDRDHPTYPIVVHLMHLVRLIRERDPIGEYSEVGRSNYKTHYRLPPVCEWGNVRYLDWCLGEIGYDEQVRFPKCGGAEEEGSCDGRAGSLMVRTQSKCRSFLERMGYLESNMLYDEFSVQDIGSDMFRELMEGMYQPVMEYSIVTNIPTWYAQIRGAL